MDELFPIGAGAILGPVLSRRPLWLQVSGVVAVALLATTLAGEGSPLLPYLMIDCAEVAFAAGIAQAMWRALRPGRLPGRR